MVINRRDNREERERERQGWSSIKVGPTDGKYSHWLKSSQRERERIRFER